MQVYENLINNAVRFAVSSVTVEASVDDGYLRITVDDDGNGFTKEALDRASEPFYTSSGKEHFGLGLYICKVLCAKHKGSLSLGQNEQQGAKVTAEFKLMW